jgi:thioredoxin-related protein
MTTINPLHYKDFFLTMERAHQTALVIFSSDRCGSCRRLKTVIQTEEFSVQVFDIDASAALGLVEEFDIHHFPTLILYKKGVFHRFFSPDIRIPVHQQVIEALNQPPQDDPSCSMD